MAAILGIEDRSVTESGLSTAFTKPNVTLERTSLRYARDRAHLSGHGQLQPTLTANIPLCGVTLNFIH